MVHFTFLSRSFGMLMMVYKESGAQVSENQPLITRSPNHLIYYTDPNFQGANMEPSMTTLKPDPQEGSPEPERKPYEAPKIIWETRLEARAGSPLSDPLRDLPGLEDR